MEFTKTENGFVKHDENGKVIAEITYSPTDNPDVVVADHTFVDFIKVFSPYLFSFLEVFAHPYLFFDFYSPLNFSQKEIINTTTEIILKIS